ncbi:transposase [Prevotella sp.]|uniref:transposase n=1 Tax=Prevotella sp. TaxID=59823 RepID=UPI0027E28432|nr:transposase [Prevotella sp.]
MEFITNNLEISAFEVANLYRHIWDIEVLFKWIKQNIVVKNLLGYSENAVRTHLWVAIIAYLIIAKIKADYKSHFSIHRGDYVNKNLRTRCTSFYSINKTYLLVNQKTFSIFPL